MASQIIPEERIRHLNDRDAADGAYVLYWMQQSQRAEDNHALEYAVQQANELGRPLLVGFGLMDGYPEANLRHYTFLLEGLQEVEKSLRRRGIAFVVRRGAPDAVALELAAAAALVVCDRGYLRHQKAWRAHVAEAAACRVTQVEADVIVPVETASDKAEYMARTLRPKVHAHLERFLVDLRTTPLERDALGLSVEGLDLGDVAAVCDHLDLDRSVPPVSALYRGGTTQAKTMLRRFLEERFSGYDEHRNQPETSDVSHMSKYLHFGQISPVYVALQVRAADAPDEDVDAYVEELLVRRELAMNFVHFTPNYDTFDALPGWARETLAAHTGDERAHVYTLEALENAETHDAYWNAAMRQMRATGYLHNYMRMYWGKKILEWTPDPREAYRRTLRLNNRYFLDGRDPNSFANVAWVFGLHDRGWKERPVFGKVRYMSAGGLRRKADPEAYVAQVDRLIEKVR